MFSYQRGRSCRRADAATYPWRRGTPLRAAIKTLTPTTPLEGTVHCTAQALQEDGHSKLPQHSLLLLYLPYSFPGWTDLGQQTGGWLAATTPWDRHMANRRQARELLLVQAVEHHRATDTCAPAPPRLRAAAATLLLPVAAAAFYRRCARLPPPAANLTAQTPSFSLSPAFRGGRVGEPRGNKHMGMDGTGTA